MKLRLILIALFLLTACGTSLYAIDDKYDVIIVIGTDRPESVTRDIAHELYSQYSKVGISTYLFDAKNIRPDFYDGSAYAGVPLYIKEFNELLVRTPLIVIVTPEYNATLPAPLIRLINMLSYPNSFKDKHYVVISVSVSPYGGIRAHEQLKRILSDLHADISNDLHLTLGPVTKNNPLHGSAESHAQRMVDFLSAY